MEIRLAQMEVVAGKPSENFNTIKEIVDDAIADDVELLVFPELCISGYLIGDMWEETSFIDDCMYYGEQVAKLAVGITIIFGNVHRFEELGTDGRPVKLNGAFVAKDGKFMINKRTGVCTPKSLLPNYREFEESRHFKDMQWIRDYANNVTPIEHMYEPYEINGVKVGITICEDGWDNDYDLKPIRSLKVKGAELILNLSCSPFTTGKNVARDRTFSAHAKNNEVPVLYVNSVGLQNNGKTIFGFDGSSVAYNKHGLKVKQLPMFSDMFMNITYDSGFDDILGIGMDEGYTGDIPSETQEIYTALKYGIGKYLEQCGLKKVVIGSSGGVDSAVAAALYAEIVGPENLLLVNMPSEFNSKTTIGLSDELARNIGCFYTSIPIGTSTEFTKAQINDKVITDGYGNEVILNFSDFDFENIQARDRSSRVLSALSCAFGGVFTNNGNKTETAVGYCVSGDSLIWSDRGLHQLKTVELNDTLHSDGRSVIASYPSMHTNVHTIETQIGNSLDCSANHEIKVIDDSTGITSFKKAEDITIDDYIAVSIGDSICGSNINIPTFKYVKRTNDYRSHDITYPRQLNDNLAKFIGICVADGTYSDSIYTITTTKLYVRDFIMDVLIDEFNMPSSCIVNRHSDQYESLGIRITSVQFCAWAKHIGLNNISHDKYVPTCITNTTKDYIFAFISGLLLDSTTNSSTSDLREITYHSVSKSLIDVIHSMLLNFGILSYKRSKLPEGDNPYWEIYIPSIESIKLLELCNPIKSSINDKLYHNINQRQGIKTAFDYIYGHNEIRRQLKRFFERNGLYATALVKWDNKVGRDVARKWINHPLLVDISDSRIDVELLHLFMLDVNSTERYFKVVNNTIHSNDYVMYDLSMDTTHEFIANGIVVHNCTIYGDHAGFLAALGDLWKSQVYELGAYLNRNGEVIPQGIFDIIPSAELSADQSLDAGNGDPLQYWYHDKLFKAWVENWNRVTPTEIIQWYYDRSLMEHLGIDRPESAIEELFSSSREFVEDLERWWKQFKGMGIAKRVQAPPIMAVSRRAFGFDYRETLNCVYFSQKYYEIKSKLIDDK